MKLSNYNCLFKEKDSWSLAAIYVFLSIQTVTLFSIGSANIKIFHIAILLIFLFSFRRIKILYEALHVYQYLCAVLALSLISYISFDFNALFFNYVFVFMLCLSIISISANTSYSSIMMSLRLGSFVIITYEIINIYINIEEILSAQAVEVVSGVRPELPYLLYGGGVNLEATWIGLAAMFFLRQKRLFWIYLIISYYIDYSLLSRSGFITTSIALFAWIYISGKVGRISLLLSIFIVLSLFVFAKSINFASDIQIINRFLEIGNEPGSMSRLYMWSFAPEAFAEGSFFGYGAGNAINSIKAAGFVGEEGNIHNYMMHNALEFGVIGLISWFYMIFSLIIKRGGVELKAYIISFILVAMVEFRGAEPIFYFVVSLLVSSRARQFTNLSESNVRYGYTNTRIAERTI